MMDTPQPAVGFTLDLDRAYFNRYFGVRPSRVAFERRISTAEIRSEARLNLYGRILMYELPGFASGLDAYTLNFVPPSGRVRSTRRRLLDDGTELDLCLRGRIMVVTLQANVGFMIWTASTGDLNPIESRSSAATLVECHSIGDNRRPCRFNLRSCSSVH